MPVTHGVAGSSPVQTAKNLLKLRGFFYFCIMIKTKFISLLFLLFFCKTLIAQNFISQTIDYDGNTREYELYIPSSYSENSLSPLMFNFHGGNGTSQGQIAISDMRDLADNNNFSESEKAQHEWYHILANRLRYTRGYIFF